MNHYDTWWEVAETEVFNSFGEELTEMAEDIKTAAFDIMDNYHDVKKDEAMELLQVAIEAKKLERLDKIFFALSAICNYLKEEHE